MEVNIIEYVAALALFDGHISIRKKGYEVIIADNCKEFLDKLCHMLKLYDANISCNVYGCRRDKAYRLRIYGKEIVHHLLAIQRELISRKDVVLLTAAIDAEGNVKQYRDQPFRTRITLKNDWKVKLIEDILINLGIRYSKYRHCRARNQCNYTVIVISNKENNRKLYSKINILHPQKISKISELFS